MKKNEITQENDAENDLTLDEFASASFSDWKQAAIQGLKGAVFEKVLQRVNLDDLRLEAFYCDSNVAWRDGYHRELIRGDSGVGQWNVGQILQGASAKRHGDMIGKALSAGQNEIRFVFPGATQSEPGTRRGDAAVSISFLADFAEAIPCELQGYPDDIAVRFHSGENGVAALSFWGALHRQRGWNIAQWHGSLGCAPLGALALTGQIQGQLSSIFNELKDVVVWMSQHAPRAGAILVDGACYHNGGSSAALEMACCLSESAVYLRELIARGVDAKTAAASLSIQMATGDDFFEDIAKMRGMRLLYGAVAKALGCSASPTVELWSRTSALFATRDEPLNNVLRTITATISGALAGAASIHASPFNETYSDTDTFAARISRNIQLILQQECQIGEVIDPCGGAYYVEHLTEALAEAAWTRFCEFEKYPGGYIGALQTGYVARLVNDQFEARQQALNKRKYKMVGVNDFVARDEADEGLKSEKRTAVGSVGHSDEKVQIPLDASGDDIVSWGIEAVLLGASYSQISERAKSDGITESVAVTPRRLAAGYERLREQLAILNKKRSTPCSVLLLRLGSVRDTKARADFSRGFFNPAGFEVTESPLCNSVPDARLAARASGADVIVLCSTDEQYSEMAAAVATGIRSDMKTLLVLAGRPGEKESEYRQGGIKQFIYLGANHFELLSAVIETLGGIHG